MNSNKLKFLGGYSWGYEEDENGPQRSLPLEILTENDWEKHATEKGILKISQITGVVPQVMKNRYKQKLIFVIAILCLSLVSCKSKTEPINNIASWTPDDGWTINAIDIRDDYANFILLYQ